MARVPRGAMSIVQTWSAGGVMKVTVTSAGPVGSTLSITGGQVGAAPRQDHEGVVLAGPAGARAVLVGRFADVDALELGGGR